MKLKEAKRTIRELKNDIISYKTRIDNQKDTITNKSNIIEAIRAASKSIAQDLDNTKELLAQEKKEGAKKKQQIANLMDEAKSRRVNVENLKRVAGLSRIPNKKLRQMNRQNERAYCGSELTKYELIYQIIFRRDV